MVKTYLVPAQEHIDDYDDFMCRYNDDGCSCRHCHAPCSYCTHPGNPHNIEFEHVYSVDSDRIVSEFHMNYLLHGTRTLGKNALQMTFAAWSVGHALSQ